MTLTGLEGAPFMRTVSRSLGMGVREDMIGAARSAVKLGYKLVELSVNDGGELFVRILGNLRRLPDASLARHQTD